MNPLKKILGLVERLTRNEEEIFGHQSTPNETCYVCKKPMKGQIIQVGAGERMHRDCWPDFFSQRIVEFAKKYHGG